MRNIEAIGWLYEVENELVRDCNSYASRMRRMALGAARRALALEEKNKACRMAQDSIALPFGIGAKVWKINKRGERFYIDEYFVSNFRTLGDSHSLYAEISPRGKPNLKMWADCNGLFNSRDAAEFELAEIKSKGGRVSEDSDGA